MDVAMAEPPPESEEMPHVVSRVVLVDPSLSLGAKLNSSSSVLLSSAVRSTASSKWPSMHIRLKSFGARTWFVVLRG